jgi:hypothetical protein
MSNKIMLPAEFLFNLNLKLGDMKLLGNTPIGERRVASIAGGSVEGQRFSGEIIEGSDCQLLRTDGVLEIDATYIVKANSGDLVRILNKGLRHGPAEVLARLAKNEPVEPNEYFFGSTMRFETSAKDLEWLNSTIAVAKGHRSGGSVQFITWALL